MNKPMSIGFCAGRQRACGAFTLVELVIVMTMIPIFMGAVTMLTIQMRARGDRLARRITQQERFARAGDRWRQDVLTARTIAVDEAGRQAALTTVAPDGQTHYIAWQTDGGGRLVRLSGPVDGSATADWSAPLERGDDARFIRQGDAWALTWTSRSEGRLDHAPVEGTAWAAPARPLRAADALRSTDEEGGETQ